MMAIVLFSSNISYANNTSIAWYTGGEAKIYFDPIPNDSLSSVVFSGKTTQKTLIVKVTKKGGNSRSNPMPLSSDGTFNVRYLLKDGAGNYIITFLGSGQKDAINYQGLGYFTKIVNMPLKPDVGNLELNSKIIEFINKVMGTTVGRGECWDVAQKALDLTLADWTRPTAFGQPINPETTEVKAGDIIQFSKLTTVEHLSGGVTKTETLGSPAHTAVIYKVLGKKQYTLAHQNVSGNRSVRTSNINLSNMISGKFWIYRPVALMIQL